MVSLHLVYTMKMLKQHFMFFRAVSINGRLPKLSMQQTSYFVNGDRVVRILVSSVRRIRPGFCRRAYTTTRYQSVTEASTYPSYSTGEYPVLNSLQSNRGIKAHIWTSITGFHGLNCCYD